MYINKDFEIMKSMIYYPGFEVKDEAWLKFALLYFEELRPIIPNMYVRENEYLSQTAIKIMNDTNLIRPYNPDYEEGNCASIIACEKFEQYLNHPERYLSLFSHSRSFDLIGNWRSPRLQNCRLYEGKFSPVFFDFCLKNGLATSFKHGILISNDLAFAYMSFLADIIAKRQGLEMFTDISKYNTLLETNDTIMSRTQNLHYKIAKTQIEFAIPCHIEDIPMNQIIKLRKNRDFENCRRAYAYEMKKYLKLRDADPNISFDSQLKIRTEIGKIIQSFGIATASVFLTCSSVASLLNGSVEPTVALATAFSNAASIKEIRYMPQYLRELARKKQANRYFAKIRNNLSSN